MKFIVLSAACLLFGSYADAQKEHFKDSVINGVNYHYVEQMPESNYSISIYINDNLHYPDSAKKYNIEGRVVISFVVNEDGSISNCKVVKGIGGGCDEEALRVVKNMPHWKPGRQDGKPVKVSYALPVVFKLQ